MICGLSVLLPGYEFRSFNDITPGFLHEIGVSFLMIDLDNTIALYKEQYPSESVMRWVANMRNSGIKLFIVSNNKRKDRVESFASALGIGYVNKAHKPSPTIVQSVMASEGYISCESAILGDQIFTDTLAANRAEIVSIVVKPISMRNPLHFLRYAAETPFRHFAVRA